MAVIPRGKRAPGLLRQRRRHRAAGSLVQGPVVAPWEHEPAEVDGVIDWLLGQPATGVYAFADVATASGTANDATVDTGFRVRSFTNSTPTATTSPQTVTIDFQAGDVIVAIEGEASGDGNPAVPTASGLTFTSQQYVNGTAGNNADIRISTAVAASSGTGVTVTATYSGTDPRYLAVYVIAGGSVGSSGQVMAAAQGDSGLINLTPAAGDIVIYATADWWPDTAAKTGVTASGTLTERLDGSVAGLYSYWIGDWAGVSAGSANFGVTSYTTQKVSAVALIVSAPVSSGTNANATVASGTGTANNATTQISPTAGSASATGTAHNATAATAVAAPATVASGTGTAHNATVSISPNAGVATATGVAQTPQTAVAPNAGSASGTGTANNATATTSVKWETITDDFPGSSVSAVWSGGFGDTPTVSGNKLTFPTTTSTYSGLPSATNNSLISSYVLVYLNPRTTGGYIGISVKSSANTDIMAASYRHTAGQLWGDWNGSDWSDSDSQGTVSFSGTDVWLRVREASGTGYMEYSTDGTSWSTIHSVTLTASALAALATAKIELNQGPFSSSITSTGSFSKFNLPPTGTNAAATVASGTGTANNATASVAPTAGAASATGAAQTPQAAVSPSAGAAGATGTAHDATATRTGNGDATVASGTGTANQATTQIAPTAGSASGTGAANDATVTTSSGGATDAPATVASATGTAHNASVMISPNAGLATATGTALAPAPSVAPSAGSAAATGTAQAPTARVAPTAGVATGTGTAYDASAQQVAAPSPVSDLPPMRAYSALGAMSSYQAETPTTAYESPGALSSYDGDAPVRSYEALSPLLST